MAILQANGVSFSYGSNPILRQVDLHVEDGDKVGFIGSNGAGKTTLLRLITGQIHPDDGLLSIRKGTRVGYLEQQIEPSEETVFSFCEAIFSDIFEIETRLRTLEKLMESDPAPEIMSEYGSLLDLFSDKNGYGIRSRVHAVLSGLKTDGSRRLSELSGGERSKVAMARLLLRNPELLILDEPTNHLDIESISWMEDFLKEYRGTILVVSHDRYFLDKLCNKIVNFEFGVATMYRGSYKAVMKQIMDQKNAQLKAYELQQKEIRRQEGIIREFYNRATELQIKKAKSRQKMLDKMERIEKPSEDRTSFHLHLKSSGRGGNEVLMARDIEKRYGTAQILNALHLEVFRGDKIGLIGGNGTGKTTLFRIIMGEEEADSGHIRFGAGIEIGYFSQTMESLNPEKSILEEVHDSFPALTISDVRGALGSFLFKDDLERKIKQCSGGEKNRIQLLKMMMSPANLLLLDEPTNHLDTYAKEILDEALNRYEGTAVIISHDRFFLNAVCNKIAVLHEGKLTLYDGNYENYLYHEEQKKKAQEEAEEKEQKIEKHIFSKRKKEKPAEKRSKKKIEQEIIALEEEIAALEAKQYEQDIYSDYQKSQEVQDQLKHLQEKAEDLYEQLLETENS